MTLFLLLDFCSFPWWLSWLLPFLLGLALGWALWSKYKSIAADLEGQVSSLNGNVTGLNGDIKGHLHNIAELEGDIAIAKGRMREAEDALAECNKKIGNKSGGTTDGNSKNSNITSSLAGAAAGATANVAAESSKGKSTKTAKGAGKFAALKPGNLQIIEGVGPKMEEVLKENGVKTWSDLSGKSSEALRGILDNYGDKYKIIDVTTWQAQAKKAADGDFEDLVTMQMSLDGGSANTLSQSDSKLQKHLVKIGAIKQYKLDDLKAVEGIGPKIEGLLKAAGINTWKDLSESTSDKIKEILDAAGSRYKLADPTTWPKQSEMAFKGQWDELREYQDFLNGGRE